MGVEHLQDNNLGQHMRLLKKSHPNATIVRLAGNAISRWREMVLRNAKPEAERKAAREASLEAVRKACERKQEVCELRKKQKMGKNGGEEEEEEEMKNDDDEEVRLNNEEEEEVNNN